MNTELMKGLAALLSRHGQADVIRALRDACESCSNGVDDDDEIAAFTYAAEAFEAAASRLDGGLGVSLADGIDVLLDSQGPAPLPEGLGGERVCP